MIEKNQLCFGNGKGLLKRYLLGSNFLVAGRIALRGLVCGRINLEFLSRWCMVDLAFLFIGYGSGEFFSFSCSSSALSFPRP